jgi:hypothetical protein
MTSQASFPFETGPLFPWIPPGENPWHITILDLRNLVPSMTSMSMDATIAETFATPRSGEEYLTVKLSVDYPAPPGITLPLAFVQRSGPVAIAAQMEDKWNVYLHEQRLFFARSWTGQLIHSATLELADSVATVTSVQTGYAEDGKEHVVREVDYLIESYVLGNSFPHPLPPSLNRSLQAVVAYSFSTHGRRGLFATYDDTLAATHPSRVLVEH